MLLLCFAFIPLQGDAIDTVAHLNVSQYLGRWYQVNLAVGHVIAVINYEFLY